MRQTATRIEKDIEQAEQKSTKVFACEQAHQEEDTTSADQENSAHAQIDAFSRGGRRGGFGGRGRGANGRGRGNGGPQQKQGGQQQQQNQSHSRGRGGGRGRGRNRIGQIVQLPNGTLKQIQYGDCLRCGVRGHYSYDCTMQMDAPAVTLQPGQLQSIATPQNRHNTPQMINSVYDGNMLALPPPSGHSSLENEMAALRADFQPRRETALDRHMDMASPYSHQYHHF